MAVNVIIGTQWGDEGKGKISDLLAEDHDFVVRFHGGPNAGHTVKVGDKTIKLHHIPSGVFQTHTTLIIANGVVIDPEILLKELADLKKAKINLKGRLLISNRAHLIFPYHQALEAIYQSAKKGTLDTKPTGRGIGPVHADKVSYLGIRLGDLFNERVFSHKLKVNYAVKKPLLKFFKQPIPKFDEVFQTYLGYADQLKQFVTETYHPLRDALAKDGRILMEGAQGTFLDVDHGLYPYTTASNMVAGAVNSGAGIPPKRISKIIGIAKAYVTRVGDSPFPTEIKGDLEEWLREKGQEYGTTTGRPRRIGWFDAEMVKASALLSGIDELVLTKLDVLSGLKKIKIAREVGYHHHGIDHIFMENAQPEYEEVEGWDEDISAAKSWGALPPQAQAYVQRIEELTEVPVKIVSVGPDRNQTIFLN